MGFYYRMFKIKLRYWYKIARIREKCDRKLALLAIAGKLVKLAFWLSPELDKQMRRLYH
jgi:hypothetical protein